ncbi:hypothetical protein ANN_05281 [Periplaneta americana]|uniref:DUF4817 domain-containing protein n=1 Tax=Periplaneta americana TaxID=6978 RepID=A0ABQ8TAP2_PERAM|nr:hypothetical protein ANN_05281 [Periplaneta americana]
MAVQLSFDEHKWILKYYWKVENVIEVQQRWSVEFGTEPSKKLTITRIRDKSEVDGTVQDVLKGRFRTDNIYNTSFINTLTNHYTRIKLKFEVLKTCVIPVKLYGCQVWSLTEQQKNLLRVCQRKMERKVLQLRLQDRIRNTDIRRRIGMQDAILLAQRLKWKWGRHVSRMDCSRGTYALTIWNPHIAKSEIAERRPRRRWSDAFWRENGAQGTRTVTDRQE